MDCFLKTDEEVNSHINDLRQEKNHYPQKKRFAPVSWAGSFDCVPVLGSGSHHD